MTMNKYRLFDIAVLSSLTIAAWKLWVYHGGSSVVSTTQQQCVAAANCTNGIETERPSQEEEHFREYEPLYASEAGPQLHRKPHPSEPIRSASCVAPYLRGCLVEFHEEGSSFAIPAYVMGYDEGEDKYSLFLMDPMIIIRNEHNIAGVHPALIHPYHVYEDGTVAHCWGFTAEASMVPCYVVSHSLSEDGIPSYTVLYTGHAEGEQHDNIRGWGSVKRFLEPEELKPTEAV